MPILGTSKHNKRFVNLNKFIKFGCTKLTILQKMCVFDSDLLSTDLALILNFAWRIIFKKMPHLRERDWDSTKKCFKFWRVRMLHLFARDISQLFLSLLVLPTRLVYFLKNEPGKGLTKMDYFTSHHSKNV